MSCTTFINEKGTHVNFCNCLYGDIHHTRKVKKLSRCYECGSLECSHGEEN